MDRIGTVFGFLGAPLAWATHLAVCYLLVAFGCTTGWSGSRPALVIATILFAVVSVLAGWTGWRGRRRDATGIHEFLGLGGAALAGLFTVAIVFAGLSPLLLPLCEFRTG
jgi:membrane protein implicated in regulation of membrane protease activity